MKKNDNFFQAFSQAGFASIVEKLTLVKNFYIQIFLKTHCKIFVTFVYRHHFFIPLLPQGRCKKYI